MSLKPCELCRRSLPLRESHLVPDFVIRWMKQGSGYLRRPAEPNKREQDGPKLEMLCEDCEQKFAVYEKWFAETVFHPYIRNSSIDLPYDNKLYYVLSSILWRCGVASHTGRTTPHTQWSRRHSEAVTKHLERWRVFLNGEGSIAPPSVHCLLTDIGTQDSVQPVVNFNRYLAHNLDLTVADDGETALIYSKFARFVLFSPVTPMDESLFEGTRIFPDGGDLRTPQAIRDGNFGQFMVVRAKISHELFQKRISARQRQIIDATVRANPERLLNSDIGALLAADYSATIKPILSRPNRYGRNKSCPCGSGKKYKRCHGQGL